MTHMRNRLHLAALISLLVVLAITPLATGAPSYAPVEDINATMLVDVGNPTAIGLVGVTLPAATALPATVAVPIPTGAKVVWAGEIVGSDPSKDPKREYTTQKAGGNDLIVFELSQARRAQVEYESPLGVNGAATTVSMSVEAPYPVKSLTVRLQTPSGAQVSEQSEGVTADASSPGYYKIAKSGLKAGDKVSASVTYTGGTPAAPSTGTGTGTGTGAAPAGGAAPTGGFDANAILVMLMAVGVIGVLWTLAKRNSKPSAEPQPEAAQAQTPPAKPARPRAPKPAPTEDDGYFTTDEPAAEPEPKKPARKRTPAAKEPAADAPAAKAAPKKKPPTPRKQAS